MKVLGIVGSYRKLGNSEILVREVLLGAREKGAEFELLRLTDFEIKPCTGCMRCVFKGEKCHIKDDTEKIFERMVNSDALVVGVPNYILGTCGILKMLLDRAMGYMYSPNLTGRPLYGKPAVGIVTHGVKGWEGISKPMMSLFLLALGYKIVDLIVATCQGPGEILFNEAVIKRCYEAGLRLANRDFEYKGEKSICPVCHNNILEVKGLEVMCPLCEIKGHIVIEDGKLGVKFDNPDNHRWTEENVRKHFENNVLPSGPRFLSLREKIKEMLKRYKEN